jgi:hypothetical protein
MPATAAHFYTSPPSPAFGVVSGGVPMKIPRLVLVAAAILLASPLAPIGARPSAAVVPPLGQHVHGAAHDAADNPGLVSVVQNATRPFVDPAVAVAAGYGPFLGCVSGTQEGAMGLHYVNSDLVFDGKLDPEHPEALMYEMRDGRLELLGVEYIVLAKAWNKNNPLPPALVGQVFTYNSSPNRYGLDAFYALHVWAWRDNPHGTFVDWNPQVSCDGFTQNP